MRICRLLLGLMLLVAMHAAALAQNRVVAPLTGTVSAGTWVCNQRLTVGAMPNGFMAYSYMLPQGYSASANIVYPLVIAEHWNDGGMNGNSYPDTSCPGGTFGGTMDTANMRRGYPAIVVAPKADQSIDTSGSDGNSNFGGYGDSPNSGGNEQGVNALVAYFKANFKVDATRVYCTGDSLGGIGCLAQMVDNNQINGVNSIFTAGLLFSDQLYRPATSPNPTSLFNRMKTVPLMAVSTPYDNSPSSYDQPAWTNDTGNSNYPTKAQYDSGGVAKMQAGSTNYYYQAVTDGTNPWDYYRALNADGGDGTAMYTWLFSQVSGSVAAETITVAAIGSKPANSVFTVSGTIANAASAPTLQYQDNGGSWVALPSGSTVTTTAFSFTHPALAAGSASIAVRDANNQTVTGSSSVTLTGSGTGKFQISNGQILDPSGHAWIAVGINMNTDDLAGAVTDATASGVKNLFPGITMIRVPMTGYPTPSQFAQMVTWVTGQNIVLEFEDHPYPIPNAYFGTDLTTEVAWYSQMAAYYKSNPYVWFGSMNEPQGSRSGYDLSDITAQQVATYNAIRGTGAGQAANTNAMILMEAGIGGGNPGTIGATAPGGSPSSYSSMTGIIWDHHMYPWMSQAVNNNVWPTDQTFITGVVTGSVSGFYGVAAAQSIQSADGVVPVISGEYGGNVDDQNNAPDHDQWLLAVTGKLSTTKLSGFLAWAWYPAAPPNDILNLVTSSRTSLSSWGNLVKAEIQAAAPVAVETLLVNTVSTKPQSTTFVVSGTISALTTAPTLQYRDNSGNWVAFPSGSAVTATSFSFTHPALTAGTYTVSVRDAANTSITATSNSFVVSGAESASNTVITTVGPAITDASGNQWTLGASGTILENANGITGPPGSGGQIVTPTTGGSITDSQGHVWTLPGGNITEDGSAVAGGGGTSQIVYSGGVVYFQDGSDLTWYTYDGSNFNSSSAPTTGAAITEIAYVNHVVWSLTSTGQWYSWSGTAWTGPSASPIASTEAIAITTIGTQAQTVGFTVTGTISGVSSVPTLQYQDDGGTWVNFPITTPTGTRLWYGQPGGNGSPWNTPMGDGATWSATTDPDTIDICRGWTGSGYSSTATCVGISNTTDNYGFVEVVGQSTDSTYKITVTNGRTVAPDNGSTATYTLHIPTGTISPGPYPGDNSMSFFDRANGTTRMYGVGLSLPPPGLQPGQGPFSDGGLGEWDDAASDLFGDDADSGNSGFIVGIGAVNYCDVDATCNPAFPHILHAQRYSTDLHLLKSNAPNVDTGVLAPDSWPQRLQDSQNPPSGPYSGNLKAGATLGIPITATPPTGLNTNCKAQFWNWQHYPLFFRDQAGGGFHMTADQVASSSQFMSDVRGCMPTLVSYLRVMRNQHQTGQSFTTNPTNGPGNRVDVGPPLLVGQGGTGTGGATVTTTTFSLPHPGMAAGTAHVIKVRDANATAVVATSNAFIVTGGTQPQTEQLTVNAIGTQTANTAFSVSGSIVNTSTAPTLQYQVSGGTWLAMPVGSSVSVSSFTFTVPGLNASSTNTIAVRDANTQTVVATSNNFAVTAAPAETIAINAISTQRVGATFTVSGTITNPASGLALQYQNNGGAWQALPAGFSLSGGVFSFTNPAPTASNTAATVGIRDASNNAVVATSNAFTVLLATSANNSVVTTVGPAIVDASGEAFALTPAGQITVNGTVDATTSSVVAVAYVSGTVWYENSSGLWRGKTIAANAWTPTAGTLTSPLPAETLAINTITSHIQNTAFQVTGTISSALVAPTLQYQVSGGLWNALPSGSAVTPSLFSFTVPGITPLGAASISVRDAGNNTISAFSNTFQITAIATETISIQPIGNQPIGAPFSVSGSITGLSTVPTLQYADGSGAFQALPNGANVTASGYSFVHPPLPAANAQTVTVRDSAKTSVSATSPPFVIVAQESANRTTVTDVGPKLVDAFGNSYQITAGGQVAVNGVADPTTANVIELVYVNRQVWFENSNLHWFARQANGSWTPVGGTILGPVPSSKPVLYHTNSAPLAVVPNFTIPIPGLVLNDTVVSGQFSLVITSVCGVISAPGATGNGTASISIKGALATVNAALAGLKFTGKTVGTGSVTLTATDPANVVATLAIVVKVPRSAAVKQ